MFYSLCILFSPNSRPNGVFIFSRMRPNSQHCQTRKLNSTAALSAGHLRRNNVTLTFDLLIPTPSNQFIFVPRCTNDKSSAKIHQQILEISQLNTQSGTYRSIDGLMHGWKNGQRHGKHCSAAMLDPAAMSQTEDEPSSVRHFLQ